MQIHNIIVAKNHIEAQQFTNWLNDQGHNAEVGNSTGCYINGVWTNHDEEANQVMNSLWNTYCNA